MPSVISSDAEPNSDEAPGSRYDPHPMESSLNTSQIVTSILQLEDVITHYYHIKFFGVHNAILFAELQQLWSPFMIKLNGHGCKPFGVASNLKGI